VASGIQIGAGELVTRRLGDPDRGLNGQVAGCASQDLREVGGWLLVEEGLLEPADAGVVMEGQLVSYLVPPRSG
jgi:hypothetical protein